jgi:hypothetical protein
MMTTITPSQYVIIAVNTALQFHLLPSFCGVPTSDIIFWYGIYLGTTAARVISDSPSWKD